MRGTFYELVTIVIGLLLAVIFFAAALSGYFYNELSGFGRMTTVILAIAVTIVCSLPVIVNSLLIRLVFDRVKRLWLAL